MNPIVQSLLETDLYKFTMWQIMLHRQSADMAEYRFVCRSTPAYPLAELVADVKREIAHLCSLRFETDELDYLRQNLPLSDDFIDFLSIFRFQERFIQVEAQGEHLSIVAKGPKIHTTGFEIFCLYIVSELYFRRFDQQALLEEGRRRLHAKIVQLKTRLLNREYQFPLQIIDFGLRRRPYGVWHEEVVATLIREMPTYFAGTSNVYLARKFGVAPRGTMAHEYFQGYQASPQTNLLNFQRAALADWLDEFKGKLSIALTDTLGIDAFLRDFDYLFAKAYDGVRHDSGDPYVWANRMIDHYRKLNIDPATKSLFFSNELTFELIGDLYTHYANTLPTGFGIGTNLVNDLGVKPLNIVMKLMSCNGQPVAKLSDAPGKTLCDDAVFLGYLKKLHGYA